MAEVNKHMIQITTTNYNEVKEYCEINGLKIPTFINQLIHDGLMIAKYGDTPFGTINVPKEPEPKTTNKIEIDGIIYTIEEIKEHINKSLETSTTNNSLTKLVEETINNNSEIEVQIEPSVNESEEKIQVEPAPVQRRPTKRRLK